MRSEKEIRDHIRELKKDLKEVKGRLKNPEISQRSKMGTIPIKVGIENKIDLLFWVLGK